MRMAEFSSARRSSRESTTPWSRARSGFGCLLLIEGPAGAGKTTLVREARLRGDSRGMSVHSARGGELEREVPFGVARQLLEASVARAEESERERLLGGAAALSVAALELDAVGDEDRSATDRRHAVRQRRVAQMAAQGLATPEIAQALFVSRKTVEMHLSHAYRTLGISSRQELAGALAGASGG